MKPVETRLSLGEPGHGSRRGLYDRRATPSERVRQQRSALLAAIRELMANGGSLNVAEITQRCGRGRNTFYEHFPTVEEALEAARHEATETLRDSLEEALRDAGGLTPGDVAKRLGETLVAFRDDGEGRWDLLVKHGRPKLDAALHHAVERVRAVYIKAGAAGGEPAPLLLWAAVGALVALVDAPELRGEGLPADVSAHAALVLSRLLR